MVTSVLNTTADLAESIQRGVKAPVREISGILNGVKAGLDVLMGKVRGFGGGTSSRVYTPVRVSEEKATGKATDYGTGDPTGADTHIY